MTYNFGLYHWRRHARRLAVAGLLLVGAASSVVLGRRRASQVVAAALAGGAVAVGYRPLRRLFSPPPWELSREPYERLAAALPLADADRVLDVGCGSGRSLVGLAPALDGARLLGLDVFDARVILGNGPALARRNAARAGVDSDVVAGDAARLPVADDSQDVVTACRVLHDLPQADAEAALREARRVLAPDGRLGVLELPIPHDADAEPLPYWRETISAAGFDVETAEQVDGYFVLVARPADA